MSVIPRPPYDAEIESLMPSIPEAMFPKTKDDIAAQRYFFEDMTQSAREIVLADPSIVEMERTIPGPRGDITLSIISLKDSESQNRIHRPAILHIHGGGLTAGNRFSGIDMIAEWVKELDAVAVLVEYRQPPENPFPAPLEDCYASLVWMAECADELGIDVDRIMVEGQSAGAGLAAAVALMARDRGGPKLCGQLLGIPMLDDRNTSISSQQFVTGGTWNSLANMFTWYCHIGDNVGKADLSYLAAPARATDLSGLPQAYIDVSSTEPFRDEAVTYASRLWACGIQAELHVWPGGPHAFDVFTPTAAVSKQSVHARSGWVRRTLKGT